MSEEWKNLVLYPWVFPKRTRVKLTVSGLPDLRSGEWLFATRPSTERVTGSREREGGNRWEGLGMRERGLWESHIYKPLL